MRIFRALAAVGFAAVTTCVVLPGTATADEVRDSQWYLETLNIAEAHKISTGKGVTIGLIDSGVDATHPDLEGAVEAGTAYGTAEDPLVDIRDHGTGMASILAGRGHGDGSEGMLGIAPDAEIISVAIGWDAKTAQHVDDWTAEAIRYLVDKGVDVISISTLTSGNTAGQEAVYYARDNGIPVIAAAGNKDIESEAMGTRFPAAYKDAIPVAGTTRDGGAWGKSADLSPASEYLAVSAPAVDLPSAKAGGGYAMSSGTSGAAPIVAGTFALVKSVYPDLDWTNLVNRVLGSVDDAGPEGIDEDFGLGIINPVKALTAEIPGQEMKDPGSEPSDEGDPTDEATDDDAATGLDDTMLIGVIAGAVVLVLIVVLLVVRSRKKRSGNGPGSARPPGPQGPPGQQWQPPQQSPPGSTVPPPGQTRQ